MQQVSFEPVFGWGVVLILAAILFASLWLTISGSEISPRRRSALVGIRLLAIMVLLLGWIRPGLISQQERESAGAIAVLIDRSQSMSLPSEITDRDRWSVAGGVWQEIVTATGLKIGQAQIVPYVFDRSLVQIATSDLPGLSQTLGSKPQGRLTDLGKTLAELGRTQLDPPLRGVILLTDAAQTAIPPEVEPTLVARQMGQLDQPVIVVGIGPRQNRGQLRDVAVEGLPEHFDAFNKKELQVPFFLKAQGVQNQPIQVKITLRASGKDSRILASKQVTSTQPSELLSQNLQIIAPESGDYLMEVEAQVDASEQVTTNNLARAFVTVREGGARILYVEGEPRAEQRFLKLSLNASKDFVVDYRWVPERTKRLWPIDLHRTTPPIEFSRYDAFIIGDLDSAALHESNWSGIRQRVSEGAGILFLGGYHSFDAGGYGTSKLAPVFPVELNSTRRQAFGGAIDPQLQTSEPTPILPWAAHPVMTLAAEPENTQIWSQLEPMLSINRLGKPVVDPGVQVLAVSKDKQPLLVAREFGGGRVLAFAGDSTYQWWLSGKQRIHKQFWRQCMLWLLRRDATTEGFVLRMDRRRLAIDDAPQLTIEWFGGPSQAPMPEKLDLELSREGTVLRKLDSAPTDERRRETRITGLNQPGLYRIKLSAEGPDGKSLETETAFIVQDESRELAEPDADWQLMANIASANQSAGGQVVLPEDVDRALDWLRQRQDQTRVTTIEKRRLGDAAWDSWLYLVVFCGLMSLEWGLRKSWQMP